MLNGHKYTIEDIAKLPKKITQEQIKGTHKTCARKLTSIVLVYQYIDG